MPKPSGPVPSRTSHDLYAPIRACTSCPLHLSCKGPVPPVGPTPAWAFFLGSSPGYNEDQFGIPFTGPTWLELESLLRPAGLTRDSVVLSNVIKCFVDDPTLADSYPCYDTWFPLELAYFKPQVVVAMGQLAIRRVLDDPSITVGEVHGIPIWKEDWSCWVLPTYHPASVLHQDRYYPALREDFQALRDLRRGIIREAPRDQFPDPQYKWSGPKEEDSGLWLQYHLQSMKPVEKRGRGREVLAVDLETTPDNRIWSIGVSSWPGSGVAAKWDQLPSHLKLPFPAVYHNALFDVPRLMAAGAELGPIEDTLVMARLLQLDEPGLKPLSRRLLGMTMQDYSEVVEPYQRSLSTDYLLNAQEVASDFPLPPPTMEENWKDGQLTTRWRKPAPLVRINEKGEDTGKISRLLQDLRAGKVDKEGRPVNPLSRWQEWGAETARIEQILGPHPQAYLAHAPSGEALRYAARDPDATLRLFHALKPRIVEEGLDRSYQIDMASFPMVCSMIANGVPVDRPYLEQARDQLYFYLGDAQIRCWEAAGQAFNPSSTHQTAHVLYHKLGLSPRRYTETGLEGTQDDDILPYRNEHQIIEAIVEFRQISKLLSTYLPAYLSGSKADGHVHCEYGQSGTGRFQGREPTNLSAIPKHGKYANLVRNGFRAEPGYLLMGWDLDQIEMREAADLSQDTALLEAFRAGRDVHTENAVAMFRITREQVEADRDRYRFPAKTSGFGVIYGLQGQGLLVQLEKQIPGVWTLDECVQFIASYLKNHPGIKAYVEERISLAHRTGEVRDRFGRRKLVPGVLSQNRDVRMATERQVINFPVQSGATSITKIGMAKVWQELRPEIKSRTFIPILQIHDEIVAQVRREAAEEIGPRVKALFEGAVELSVPVLASVKAGERLGELEG